MATLTIRLDADLEADLTRLAEASKRSKSELVREMLRRQVALAALERVRSELIPQAERLGILSDEDVFKAVS